MGLPKRRDRLDIYEADACAMCAGGRILAAFGRGSAVTVTRLEDVIVQMNKIQTHVSCSRFYAFVIQADEVSLLRRKHVKDCWEMRED